MRVIMKNEAYKRQVAIFKALYKICYKDYNRDPLNCIFVNRNNIAIATDGHSLAAIKIDWESEYTKNAVFGAGLTPIEFNDGWLLKDTAKILPSETRIDRNSGYPNVKAVLPELLNAERFEEAKNIHAFFNAACIEKLRMIAIAAGLITKTENDFYTKFYGLSEMGAHVCCLKDCLLLQMPLRGRENDYVLSMAENYETMYKLL